MLVASDEQTVIRAAGVDNGSHEEVTWFVHAFSASDVYNFSNDLP